MRISWLRALRPRPAGQKTLLIMPLTEGGGADVCIVAWRNPSPCPACRGNLRTHFYFWYHQYMAW